MKWRSNKGNSEVNYENTEIDNNKNYSIIIKQRQQIHLPDLITIYSLSIIAILKVFNSLNFNFTNWTVKLKFFLS